MKKFIFTILCFVIATLSLLFMSGCVTNNKDHSKTESSLMFKTLSVNNNKVNGKVSNSTENFSFINEIETTGNTKFIVSLDIYGINQVITKTIALTPGNNTVYIIEMLSDEPKNIYEVTIRRRPMYIVEFNTLGGTFVDSQLIEEECNAEIPQDQPIRQGYNFDKWDYDFSTPIMQNTIVNANWNTITYNISYNLNGGTLDNCLPTTYTVEDEIILKNSPSKIGYNFKGWSNNGKIEKGTIGDKCFIANYSPITYSITYDLGDYGKNDLSNPTYYTIESDTIVLNSPYDINADFIKWKINEKTITTIPKGSCGNLILTAVWDKYDVKLQENDNTFSVIGINTSKNNIIIKSTYKNKKVTAIEANAFSDCNKLLSITIPSGITYIGYHAFYNCSSLTNISIPDSVIDIDNNAFVGCSGIAKISVSYDNKIYYSIDNCIIKTETKTLIFGCKNSTIPIDLGVTTIGENAFCGCNELTRIYIPNNITTIEKYAFKNCSRLTNLTIINSSIFIKEFAFANCNNLTTATIPTCATKHIPKNNLESVTINGGTELANLGGCDNLTNINISNSVTTIKDYAFLDCKKLTSITIPESVTSINYCAFSECSNLTNIIILNSSISVNEFAFSRCDNIKKAIIPTAAIKYIPKSNLESVTINGGTIIEKNAFTGCSKLTIISISPSVTSIDSYAFEGCSNITNAELPSYAIRCIPKNNLKYVTLNAGDTIGNSAFFEYYNLISVSIPNSITSIGDYAFYKCNKLASITIPNSIQNIGNYSFYFCSQLNNVTIADSVKSIGNYAFSYCKSLVNIHIPNSVTTIGDYSFTGCHSLTSATIGTGLSFIGDSAFFECFKLIEIINNSNINIKKDSNNGYIGYYSLLILFMDTITNQRNSV